MNKNFLDYTGLTKYTKKIESLINSKVAGLVPQTRKVNAKPLSEDVTLTAYDVDAVPVTRQINGHQLGFDLNLTASDLNAVPTSRTVNGKALTDDITITAADIGVSTPDLSGYVPTSRTVNGKALTSNITLSASDVSARPSSWTPTASDVGARPSTWTPTAAQVGAVPTSRTVNGKALSSDITLTADDIGVTAGVGKSMAGQSVKPTSSTTVTAGDGAEVFNDYRNRTYSDVTVNAGNIASGQYSHAEGTKTTASGNYSHAEGNYVYASGEYSHAEGYSAQAIAKCSHAEGRYSEAKGDYTHAEGYQTTASGQNSHAEGNSTEASGTSSHAEGHSTTASAQCSHAEGDTSTASGSYSHAEGIGTTASGSDAHAEGNHTTASNRASHASGKYNKAMTSGATINTTVGDVFVVGNGTSTSALSNALRLAYEGTLYLTKAYNSTGADYAEYFEWLDGNPQNEDRVGRFVTLQGDKITLAKPGDYILGVVSGQPCIIGNADEDWLGRWEHDDFNRFVKEYLVDEEVEVTPPTDLTDNELQTWLFSNNVTEREGHYFKMEAKVVDYVTPSWRHKANPNYDPSQIYVERKYRPEWDAVGMVGVLSVIDDGSCTVNGYCKVTTNGIATAAVRHDTVDTWRVIDRVNNSNIVKVIFSIK